MLVYQRVTIKEPQLWKRTKSGQLASEHQGKSSHSSAMVVRALFRIFTAEKWPEIPGLVMTNIAIENCHLYWIYPLNMVILHTYVSLPEGTTYNY